MNDINWRVPSNNHVASIVPPRATVIKVLVTNVSRTVKILALDWALAAAFSFSDNTLRKKGI